MTGYLRTTRKEECFGCGACFQICPKQAIMMHEDIEGFLYPQIDETRCVSCNLCHKVCPAENMPKKKNIQQAFIGFSLDSTIRRNSASGGAFKAITDAASDDTVVFGVEWKDRSHAVHGEANSRGAYQRFSKSKYVQSSTERTYREVKELLARGKKVIYTGTPCQIAGLKSFLHQDDNDLLCIDLVCHGVPNSRILEAYFRANETPENPIVHMDFREKCYRHGEIDSKCAVLHFANGKSKIVDYESSGFLRGFANGLFFRPSCSKCPFACADRLSDLTIGDAWGVEKIQPEMNPHHGVSLILVNSNKGKRVIPRMLDFMELSEADPAKMVAGNGRLKSPDKGHTKRTDFFQRYDVENFEKLVQEYIPHISILRKIGSKIKSTIKR